MWAGIYIGDEFPEYYGQRIIITDDNSNENNPCYMIRFLGESQWHDNMSDDDIEFNLD